MRGADYGLHIGKALIQGEPPRARDRPALVRRPGRDLGRTPAVRGRQGQSSGCSSPCGRSLRARGRLHDAHADPVRRRTPACAGPTTTSKVYAARCRENPRVRGADDDRGGRGGGGRGEPPRARGRRTPPPVRMEVHRRTPACAGPTHCEAMSRTLTRENPRVRGADIGHGGLREGVGGEPPRARGRHLHSAEKYFGVRRTPACAGPTGTTGRAAGNTPENPRVRGADTRCDVVQIRGEGEPPRARGRRAAHHAHRVAAGRTPACAGRPGVQDRQGRRWGEPLVRRAAPLSRP